MAEKEYISREEAIEWLYDNSNLPIDSGTARAYWTRVVQIKDALIRHIKTIPAADVVEVVHGEWIPDYETFVDEYERETEPIQVGWVCSLCGRQEVQKEPYCNCGAKMDGGKHDV